MNYSQCLIQGDKEKFKSKSFLTLIGTDLNFLFSKEQSMLMNIFKASMMEYLQMKTLMISSNLSLLVFQMTWPLMNLSELDSMVILQDLLQVDHHARDSLVVENKNNLHPETNQ